MKRKISLILCVACLVASCLGLVACAQTNTLEEYQKQGYTVMVTYHANGGSFLNRVGITVVDMIRPSDYQKDGNGEVHIKLTEPTDPTRPTSGSDPITLTLANHFFAGWYQERTLVLNSNGNPIDSEGNELKLKEGETDVYVNVQTGYTATPQYTYDKYWDFENDTIDYSEDDGLVELNLYAGWVSYYSFNYHVQNEAGEWEIYATTNFDYKTTNAENSKTADKDTIWVPQWQNGGMNYSFKYQDGSNYNFPKITGTTFLAAYADKDCTQPINQSMVHGGTLDLEHGTSVNPVQNVYVKVEQGERYKIETAQQLIDNANVNGYYEIYNDLDFTGLRWPAAFQTGVFAGKMYGANGATVTLSNISATHSSASSLVGGLFGKIDKTAQFTNVHFANATLDIAYTGQRLHETNFGLFAGYIEEGAVITNVAVGGTLKIGTITLGRDYSFNLYANGYTSGITQNLVKLTVYGQKLNEQYNYTVDPESVTVDSQTGNISLTLVTSKRLDQEAYEIQ
ncbi:MAG: hypothetical protein IJW13_02820 [Clostridia bacterium]|nr:hypothetical protein [Clostridia bacterium]